VAQMILATSVAFVEELSAFLYNFYGELTNDEHKTSVKEAWSLVCSIVRRTFDGIAVHRFRASLDDFQEGGETASSDGVPLGLASCPSRYGRVDYLLYHHRVPWSVFDYFREEVSEAHRVAKEAKRRVDRLTTASCGGGRGGGGASDED
jgi:hypothetical protein